MRFGIWYLPFVNMWFFFSRPLFNYFVFWFWIISIFLKNDQTKYPSTNNNFFDMWNICTNIFWPFSSIFSLILRIFCGLMLSLGLMLDEGTKVGVELGGAPCTADGRRTGRELYLIRNIFDFLSCIFYLQGFIFNVFFKISFLRIFLYYFHVF
jgi:hypothetical protein